MKIIIILSATAHCKSGSTKLTADLKSNCPQIEVNDRPTGLGETCGQHIKPLHRFWLSRQELLL